MRNARSPRALRGCSAVQGYHYVGCSVFPPSGVPPGNGGPAGASAWGSHSSCRSGSPRRSSDVASGRFGWTRTSATRSRSQTAVRAQPKQPALLPVLRTLQRCCGLRCWARVQHVSPRSASRTMAYATESPSSLLHPALCSFAAATDTLATAHRPKHSQAGEGRPHLQEADQGESRQLQP
jgi:hypothetical protein